MKQPNKTIRTPLYNHYKIIIQSPSNIINIFIIETYEPPHWCHPHVCVFGSAEKLGSSSQSPPVTTHAQGTRGRNGEVSKRNSVRRPLRLYASTPDADAREPRTIRTRTGWTGIRPELSGGCQGPWLYNECWCFCLSWVKMLFIWRLDDV